MHLITLLNYFFIIPRIKSTYISDEIKRLELYFFYQFTGYICIQFKALLEKQKKLRLKLPPNNYKKKKKTISRKDKRKKQHPAGFCLQPVPLPNPSAILIMSLLQNCKKIQLYLGLKNSWGGTRDATPFAKSVGNGTVSMEHVATYAHDLLFPISGYQSAPRPGEPPIIIYYAIYLKQRCILEGAERVLSQNLNQDFYNNVKLYATRK